MPTVTTALQTADWRQQVFDLYARVRDSAQAGSPSSAHALWRAGRDRLFATHPASPLDPTAAASFDGLAVAEYQSDYRFEAVIDDDGVGEEMTVPTGTDGTVTFQRLGTVGLDGVGRLALWRLASYGGGLFLPLRDGSAGQPSGTYGGGRYVLDTVKGSHLGVVDDRLVIDLNFAYNPSCAYDESWACPLPGADNRVGVELRVGELYSTY
ncbi:DUF1684 domain-containing protein [Arthrobacter sp. TMN-50]